LEEVDAGRRIKRAQRDRMDEDVEEGGNDFRGGGITDVENVEGMEEEEKRVFNEKLKRKVERMRRNKERGDRKQTRKMGPKFLPREITSLSSKPPVPGPGHYEPLVNSKGRRELGMNRNKVRGGQRLERSDS